MERDICQFVKLNDSRGKDGKLNLEELSAGVLGEVPQ